MKLIPWLLPAALCLAGFPPPVDAGDLGRLPDKIGLDDFAQTEAKSFDDFTGRLVLIEAFAYW